MIRQNDAGNNSEGHTLKGIAKRAAQFLNRFRVGEDWAALIRYQGKEISCAGYKDAAIFHKNILANFVLVGWVEGGRDIVYSREFRLPRNPTMSAEDFGFRYP